MYKCTYNVQMYTTLHYTQHTMQENEYTIEFNVESCGIRVGAYKATVIASDLSEAYEKAIIHARRDLDVDPSGTSPSPQHGHLHETTVDNPEYYEYTVEVTHRE